MWSENWWFCTNRITVCCVKYFRISTELHNSIDRLNKKWIQKSHNWYSPCTFISLTLVSIYGAICISKQTPVLKWWQRWNIMRFVVVVSFNRLILNVQFEITIYFLWPLFDSLACSLIRSAALSLIFSLAPSHANKMRLVTALHVVLLLLGQVHWLST